MSYFYVQYGGGGFWCEGIAIVGAGSGAGERMWLYEDERQIKANTPAADKRTSDVTGINLCLDPTKNWQHQSGTARATQMTKIGATTKPPPSAMVKAADVLNAYRKQVDDEVDAILAAMSRAHMMRLYFKINALGITLNGPAGSLMTEYRIELERQLKKRDAP